MCGRPTRRFKPTHVCWRGRRWDLIGDEDAAFKTRQRLVSVVKGKHLGGHDLVGRRRSDCWCRNDVAANAGPDVGAGSAAGAQSDASVSAEALQQ